MDKLYIIIPAYNEQDNIEKVVHDWYQIIDEINGDSKLVVIDDGSKDRTSAILKKNQKKYPKLMPIKKENEGHGATVLYGYKYAIDNNCDYVFQTDSDGQTDPLEFWEFWKERKNYDMIIGHRKHRQDGISRIFVTKILKFVLLVMFHVNITDANTPFRLLKVKTLKKYIHLIPDKYHLSNVILSVIYAKYKLNVKYHEITFKPRQGGVNSINLKKIFRIGKNSLIEFHNINKEIDKEIKNEKKQKKYYY